MIHATTHGFALSWDSALVNYNPKGELLYAHYRRKGRLIFVPPAHVNRLAYFKRQGEMEMLEGSPLRTRAIRLMNEARQQVGMAPLTDEETGETA